MNFYDQAIGWLPCIQPIVQKRIVMRVQLLLLSLFVLILQLQAYDLKAQRLTLNANQKSLENVLKEMNRQTGYDFLYNAEQLKKHAAPVTISGKNMPLEELLTQVFDQQPRLSYTIDQKTVVIRPKRKDLTQKEQIIVQERIVTGQVRDENGQPLSGVSVLVKGTTIGASTDQSGGYSIETPNSTSVLVFSYLGYVSQEVSVQGRSEISVVLRAQISGLEEVVVVGFGTQKKENLTGAVASVDMKALESRPVSQLGQALQGVVPGLNLNVSGLGGELGQTLSTNIRGTGTIGQGSSASPLILIDGMEGNMNNLNPADIESISVLKDASSAAVYGSRASFGVILITTKSGKEGKMRITYNNNFRYSGPTNLPNQLDSWRFANYFNDAAANEGVAPIFNDETLARIQQYIAGEISTTTIPNGQQWHFHQQANDNVNWFKEHFTSSWSGEHNIQLNGGSDKLQYYFSSSYLDQDGILRHGDDNYKRFNSTAKINAKVNKFIDFNVNTRFIRFKLDNPLYSDMNGLLYHDIVRIWPMMPFKDPNGHYMRNGKLIQMEDGGRAVTNNDNLYGQAELVIRPLKNWNIYVQGGVRTINQNKHRFLNPIYEYDINGNPLALNYSGDYAVGATFAETFFDNSNFYTSSIYSDYTVEKGGHLFKGMLGMNTEDFKTRNLGASRSDVITPEVPEIGAATGEDRITSSTLYDWATVGFFGRANYSYGGRYLFEANLRYDGSSRFLADQRWTWLPSFSLGWNIANEPFFESYRNIVSQFKPRVSWGKLGNQNTNAIYPFYLTQSVNANAGNWLINGSRPTTAGVPGMISNYLTWEKVYNTNIGLDMALLGNRLMANFDYFIRVTDDMVGPPAEVGAALGIGLPPTNNAKLRNKGWELMMNWRDNIGSLGYEIGFNLSDNRVKVEKYPNKSMALNTFYDGQELGEIWGYETQGIAKSQEEMDNWLSHTSQSVLGSNWGAGDIMYKDLDGDGEVNAGSNTLNDHGDLRVIGNNNPRYRFGINLGATYKGWDFSAFLQGVLKRDLWLDGPMFWGMVGNVWQAAGFEEHLDYFRPEDTESIFGPNLDPYYPRAYMGGRGSKNQNVQTRYLQNGSYMRIKNVQLGYTLPESYTNTLHMQRIRLFFSAENLITFSKIAKMYDPEAVGGPWGSGKTYPLNSTVSFGVNLTF